MQWKELVDKFLMQYEMNSIHTKHKYKKDLSLFFNVCNCDDLSDFDENNLSNFYKYAESKKWKANTINQRLQIVKIFTAWAFKRGCIKNDFMCDIKKLRTINNVHFTPTKEEFVQLLTYVQKHTHKQRLGLMLRTMFETGARRSEICNIKCSDIDFDNGYITILGKGNKKESQPISSDLLNDLKHYIESERKQIQCKYTQQGGTDLDFLFVGFIGDECSHNRNLHNGNKILDNVLYAQIKRYAKLAKLPNADKWGCHCIRRAGTTEIYNETGDILLASKFARHSSPTITSKNYINFNKEKLKEVVSNLSSNGTNSEYELFLELKKKFE